jgi:toxin-antitoxin system PIN domain toxin
MFMVDTNVFVYAADVRSPAHTACKEALEGWRARAGAWFTSWSIVYEFLRVVSHPRVLRTPWNVVEAWRFVEALLASAGLEVLSETSRHADVAAEVFADLPWLTGNLLHDAHTAVLMREHGVRRIYTRDADFHRFPFLEVVDPLSERRPG